MRISRNVLFGVILLLMLFLCFLLVKGKSNEANLFHFYKDDLCIINAYNPQNQILYGPVTVDKKIEALDFKSNKHLFLDYKGSDFIQLGSSNSDRYHPAFCYYSNPDCKKLMMFDLDSKVCSEIRSCQDVEIGRSYNVFADHDTQQIYLMYSNDYFYDDWPRYCKLFLVKADLNSPEKIETTTIAEDLAHLYSFVDYDKKQIISLFTDPGYSILFLQRYDYLNHKFVDEKINVHSNFLPAFLVDNTKFRNDNSGKYIYCISSNHQVIAIDTKTGDTRELSCDENTYDVNLAEFKGDKYLITCTRRKDILSQWKLIEVTNLTNMKKKKLVQFNYKEKGYIYLSGVRGNQLFYQIITTNGESWMKQIQFTFD